jgi:hypothetical protein
LESEELLKEPIIAQIVEVVVEKSTQVTSQVEDISGRFQVLDNSMQKAHTTRVARDEPHVSVGGQLVQTILGKSAVI